MGRKNIVLGLTFCFMAIQSGFAERATSLPDAQAAIEANLRTPEGKKYDQQLGLEFVEKHLAPFRQCKQSASKDMRSFWILLKLDKNGTVSEALFSPETAIATCARERVLHDRFSPPPHPAYWVSIYMKISR